MGNLAVQTLPQPAAGERDGMEFSPFDEGSIPSSSQESIDSTIMAPSNTHKRSFGQDSESDQEDEIIDSHQTPRWPSRTILRPKLARKTRRFVANSRSAKFDASQNNKLDDMWGLSGQENRDPASAMLTSIDFEEAAFLRRREEVDEDSEMGGV